MNVKRGLMRLWIVFSILWVGLFLGISAPIWYNAAQLWSKKAELDARQLRVAEHKNSAGACVATGRKCFDVTTPNGSQYVVKVADTETETSVATIARHNLDKFNEPRKTRREAGVTTRISSI